MTTPVPDHGITPQMVSNATGGQIAADTPGLQQVIDEAVGAVRRWCGWHVWPERTEELTLDGPGTDVARLRSLHVVSVAGVTEDGVPLTYRDDYTWSIDGWLTRKKSCRWTTEDQGLVVNLVHGYAAEDVADVIGLVTGVAGRTASNPMALSSYEVGERREGYSTGISGAALLFGGEQSTLSEYRLPR